MVEPFSFSLLDFSLLSILNLLRSLFLSILSLSIVFTFFFGSSSIIVSKLMKSEIKHNLIIAVSVEILTFGLLIIESYELIKLSKIFSN